MRTFLYSGLTALFIALVCSANLVQGEACYGAPCNTDDDCPKSSRQCTIVTLRIPYYCYAACIDGTCQQDPTVNLVQKVCYGGPCNTDDDCPKSWRRCPLQMPYYCFAACIDGICQQGPSIFEGDAANSTAETALSAAAKESFSVLSVLLFFVGMWM